MTLEQLMSKYDFRYVSPISMRSKTVQNDIRTALKDYALRTTLSSAEFLAISG